MRQQILLLAILFSSFCFSQSTGSILGIVLDGELNNAPLINAKITIEGTNLEASSDGTGIFYFENLEEGNYMLEFSFIGYETKEFKVQVASNHQADVSATIIASSISLNDLAFLNITAAKQEDKASIVSNN